MIEHPTALPDEVVRELSDLAQSFGYGIENLTLVWATKDLGLPMAARAFYATALREERSIDGKLTLRGTL